jgi:ABC-type Zn uptake system ZnuABC Zn-binding protein ZnuA
MRIAATLAFLLAAATSSADPLRVVATTPDLADLARAVGGEEVAVTELARGPQDPHYVEPRPSFVRELHRADLFVLVGMDLEIGWAPVLLRSARNPAIQPGRTGYLDASRTIEVLEVPEGPVDRSMGDVHPFGNPHYLSDPVNGLRVARALRERLAALRPEASPAFADGYAAFARALARRLVGERLAARHDPEQLIALVEADRLDAFLAGRAERGDLGGWLAAVRPVRGTRAVQDHGLWPYFARRFGLELVGTLEPRPGIAPTTSHLAVIVERIREQGVRLILASPYVDSRHARFVADHTDARVVEMAHQAGARPGVESYLDAVGHNVAQLARTP